jgi:uncharacterized membrane protein
MITNHLTLILGLSLFVAIHMVPLTNTRARLVGKLGAGGYKGVFSVVALVGLILIILGFRSAETQLWWAPIDNGRAIAMWLMPLALILNMASGIPCNIAQLVRHPMLAAVILWGVIHLLVNGDSASTLIFASFVIYSIANIIWTRKSSPIEGEFSLTQDFKVVVLGLAVYGLLVYFHEYYTGVMLVA